MNRLYCGARTLELDRPAVMGIINLTPDSFSGDGVGSDVERAIAQAMAMVEAGADLLDLGAESSRPGAASVPAEDEVARLLPVLRALRDCGVPLSVDTCKPEVMRAVLDEGAAIINDIRALGVPGAAEAVAASDCAVCLMHMRGVPADMQTAPVYEDVVGEVRGFLLDRVRTAVEAGIAPHRCWVDPGFGFGKTIEHNTALFRALPAIVADDAPVLVGVSRKSMLGSITGRPVGDRLAAGLAAAVLAAEAGAAVIRVHEVAATIDALNIWRTLAPANWGVQE
jgi:dihydropteroate synthase